MKTKSTNKKKETNFVTSRKRSIGVKSSPPIEERIKDFDKEFDRGFYWEFETDEGVEKLKSFISTLLKRERVRTIEEIREWAIENELPSVNCHSSHRDLADGFNQALLKLRQFLDFLKKGKE